MTTMTRRRVIRLMAAGGLMSCGASLAGASGAGSSPSPWLHLWHGQALGADVSLQIYHADKSQADRIIDNAVGLLREMEGLFSLYRTDSLLNQLNTTGMLLKPAAPFLDLLRTAQQVSHATQGAFDITVQPLWQFYKNHFTAGRKTVSNLSAADLAAVRRHIGYDGLLVTVDKIAFARPGMAATLNGIAQGYVTDQVSAYLAQEGLTEVLVDMGEYRALGPQAGGAPWRIGLADPFRPGGLADVLEMRRGAVATSSGSGDIFDPQGDYHHLLDPRTGLSPSRYASVTVTAPEATTADALSTAFCSLSEPDIRTCLKSFSGTHVRLTDPQGHVALL
ncbi:FAD:protein FMN transferase [Paremcibacter congregatus]|uniref:FAD:protein FMN transferase n=1 Tax=Paremcibacter congregatus TaxID=2043170 RepID=UPI003A8CA961